MVEETIRFVPRAAVPARQTNESPPWGDRGGVYLNQVAAALEKLWDRVKGQGGAECDEKSVEVACDLNGGQYRPQNCSWFVPTSISDAIPALPETTPPAAHTIALTAGSKEMPTAQAVPGDIPIRQPLRKPEA